MFFPAALGLCGVLCIMLQPARLLLKGPMGRFANKIFSSMFFCLAGVAGASLRERLDWQAAALLFGFCLACLGDALLAIGPVLAHPERDKGYAFVMGAVPFFLAHVLNLAVLLSRAEASPWLLPLLLVLPAVYAVLWRRKIFHFGRVGGPLLVYALLLGALAWVAAQTHGALRWLSLPATCMLALSDTSLFYFNFGPKKETPGGAFSWLVMFPYYLAQALMACAVAYV
ncbi:MAG: lysoplasmalogenase [Oscillospiraceae bacterium]|nr:lysoplasmalogenase [Oscillospiraceae bacterium]